MAASTRKQLERATEALARYEALQRDLIVQLRAEGASLRDIAPLAGKSHATIRTLLANEPIANIATMPRRRGGTATALTNATETVERYRTTQRELIVQLSDEGASLREIALLAGKSHGTIRTIITNARTAAERPRSTPGPPSPAGRTTRSRAPQSGSAATRTARTSTGSRNKAPSPRQ